MDIFPHVFRMIPMGGMMPPGPGMPPMMPGVPPGNALPVSESTDLHIIALMSNLK